MKIGSLLAAACMAVASMGFAGSCRTRGFNTHGRGRIVENTTQQQAKNRYRRSLSQRVTASDRRLKENTR